MAKTHDWTSRARHERELRKLANRYARAFNTVAESRGLDLSLELCMKLVTLFIDALGTGAALEKDYSRAAMVAWKETTTPRARTGGR